jgi:GntR family transcriptional regulator/MocR family aminotransferase
MRQVWTSIQPELLVPLERGAGRSLRSQVEERLRSAIRAGTLVPGSQLPATRVLARDLGLSCGLVVEAYAQLAAEGYLDARPGGTTRVTATARRDRGWAGAELAAPPLRYDFRPGLPDLSLFPRAAWLAALRQALAAYLGRVRGVAADPARLIVCSGFAQGLGLLCRALRRSGARRLAVEDPTHPGQRLLIARAGLEPVPVPVDTDGLRVEAWAGLDVGGVLMTPAHQFPSGVVLAPARRAALREAVREAGFSRVALDVSGFRSGSLNVLHGVVAE